MLILSAIAILAQVVPLPYRMLRLVDPHVLTVRTSLWLTSRTDDPDSLWLPISIMPRDTLAALGIFLASAVLFWTCRSVCERGGTGRIVRAIAFIGLAASIAAIVQRAQSKELLYGFWRPIEAGARPYGPFVNRNHFATWIVMACPLVFGYVLARTPIRDSPAHSAQRVANALKELGSIRSWLVASVCVMTLALLISASRSGIIALMSALVVTTLLTRNSVGAIRRWTLAQGILLVIVAVSFANLGMLVDRFDQTLKPSNVGRGRTAIWADTVRLIGDFPLTGTGAGTFGEAIVVYQTSEPGYSIGNAHNHYLQLIAEGGALVAFLAAVIVGGFFALFLRRVRHHADPDYLVRVGAIAGVTGALVQSVWETGLRMPANAMLLAVLAAIATHSVRSLRVSA